MDVITQIVPPVSLKIIPLTLKIIVPVPLKIIPSQIVIPSLNTTPTSLKIIPPLTLKVIPPAPISDHVCYILKSSVANKVYIGYTIDFERRLRQHNGEIVGGAKKTHKWRPWYPICVIKGFYESSAALRFEYRLQHPRIKRKAREDSLTFILNTLSYLITNGDGSVVKDNKMPWPQIIIRWYHNYSINLSNVINTYT